MEMILVNKLQSMTTLLENKDKKILDLELRINEMELHNEKLKIAVSKNGYNLNSQHNSGIQQHSLLLHPHMNSNNNLSNMNSVINSPNIGDDLMMGHYNPQDNLDLMNSQVHKDKFIQEFKNIPFQMKFNINNNEVNIHNINNINNINNTNNINNINEMNINEMNINEMNINEMNINEMNINNITSQTYKNIFVLPMTPEKNIRESFDPYYNNQK